MADGLLLLRFRMGLGHAKTPANNQGMPTRVGRTAEVRSSRKQLWCLIVAVSYRLFLRDGTAPTNGRDAPRALLLLFHTADQPQPKIHTDGCTRLARAHTFMVHAKFQKQRLHKCIGQGKKTATFSALAGVGAALVRPLSPVDARLRPIVIAKYPLHVISRQAIQLLERRRRRRRRRRDRKGNTRVRTPPPPPPINVL